MQSICIDSVMKIDKKNYPQVYSEQCKYKIKKKKAANFIDILSSGDSIDSEYFFLSANWGTF